MSEVDRERVAERSLGFSLSAFSFFCHGYYTTMYDKWHQSQGSNKGRKPLGSVSARVQSGDHMLKGSAIWDHPRGSPGESWEKADRKTVGT